jgi:hypothetical protein
VASGPRNHLNLLNGRVARFERSLFVCGETQDTGEITVQGNALARIRVLDEALSIPHEVADI